VTGGFTRENPSPRYRTLLAIYARVHETGLAAQGLAAGDVFAGHSLHEHIPPVRALVSATGAGSILDYGSGKGAVYAARDLTLPNGDVATTIREYWAVDRIECYDPGVPAFASRPSGTFDGVVCTDVLEHVPEEDLDWLLRDLFGFADRFVYANIAAYPAEKILPNGWNAHVTVEGPSWWRRRIRSAAEGWRGGRFEFVVTEPVGGLAGRLRRLGGRSRWRRTRIVGHGTAAAHR
jgi:hypothetical protein